MPPAAKVEAKTEPKPEPKPEPAKDNKPAAQTIRVNVEVLENLMTLVSEMVLTRNQLLQLTRSADDSVFKEPIERLSRTAQDTLADASAYASDDARAEARRFLSDRDYTPARVAQQVVALTEPIPTRR